jgi:hypothetical protein
MNQAYLRESWASARYDFAQRLLTSDPVYVGEWQSQKSISAANTTYEILNATFEMQMPPTADLAARMVGANLPWAEDHFQERVSGEPLNPPPSNAWWPFAQAGNAMHKAEEKFSHTYPERYWPKRANPQEVMQLPNRAIPYEINMGIRYPFGDLQDVVDQLYASPYTRQAYLPVFFPEDTGAAFGQRVPCTLGYQFLIREGAAGKRLHIFYHMRSCDFMRHLADDIYMTIRLAQWMRERLQATDLVNDASTFSGLSLGRLYFTAGSLHIFEPDRLALAAMHREMTNDYSQRLSNYASGNGAPVDE